MTAHRTSPPRTARLLWREVGDQYQAMGVAEQAALAAAHQYDLLHGALETRFGLTIPHHDALLLDVLALVDVSTYPGHNGDPRRAFWTWTGGVNRKGTAVVRTDRHERGASRVIAEGFRLIEPGDPRPLRPAQTRGPLDVNPWMRYLGGQRVLDLPQPTC